MTTPNFIPVPSQDDEVTRIINGVRTRIANWAAATDDPGYYMAEWYAELNRLQLETLNRAVRELALDTATGVYLDRLIGQDVLPRRTGETDDAYRVRNAEFLHSTRYTAPYYIRVAQRDTNVSDGDLIELTPPNFDFYIQGPGFTRSTTALRASAQTELNSRDIRRVNEVITVRREMRLPFVLSGIVRHRPDASPETVRSMLATNLTAANLALRKLGGSVYDTDLVRRAWVDGIADIQLTITRVDDASHTPYRKEASGALDPSEFKTRGTARTYEIKPPAGGEIDVGVGDTLTFTRTGVNVSATVTSAVWQSSDVLWIDTGALTYTQGGFNDTTWQAASGSGYTLTFARANGDRVGRANEVQVGSLSTTGWQVGPVGGALSAAGPLTT